MLLKERYSLFDQIDLDELISEGYLEYLFDNKKISISFEGKENESYSPDQILKDLREGEKLFYNNYGDFGVSNARQLQRKGYRYRKIQIRDEPYLSDGILGATDMHNFVIFNPRQNYTVRVNITEPHEAIHTQGYPEWLIDDSLKARRDHYSTPYGRPP